MRRPLWHLGACLLLALGHAMAGAQEPTIAFTVSPRDTLIGLSERLLVSPDAWREVAALNRLGNPNLLIPGDVLQIPVRLLRWRPAEGRLLSATGEVRVDGRAGAAAEPLSEGQSIETGAEASAVLELADATRVKLAPSSLAEVLTSRRHSTSADPAGSASGGLFSGALRLLRGSVEVFATKVLRAKPLEVTTPTAVIGVRGTQYRVGFEPTATLGTRAEVIEGAVRFDVQGQVTGQGTSQVRGVDLSAGFGAAGNASGAEPAVARLLAAPELSSAPARFERTIVRFTLPGESQALRLQVAADAAFDRVVRDLRLEPGAEVRIAGLDDGTWHLRARRIDALGIEGFDATQPFVLKARPEPPAATQPRRGAKQAVGDVDFAWAQNVEAASQRLQIARDEAFVDKVVDLDGLSGLSTRVPLASPGPYFWRLASVRPTGDQGPFGDAQAFELRPTPEPPQGGLAGDGNSLRFSWAGRAQDRQRVELARDAAFTDIVASADLGTPEWVLPKPQASGDYYFRYRSIEPDGFVSPYSATLKTVVPKDWSFLWLLFPMLFAL